MRFDEEGHLQWTPTGLYNLIDAGPQRLVDRYLLNATPRAFPTYAGYHDFLEEVAGRIAVHPKNLFLRGSCQIGFSIAPKRKAWTAMGTGSDLDLAIVDEDYFGRLDRQIQICEEINRAEFFSGDDSRHYVARQKDRRDFNCCRADPLPGSLCVHHQDMTRSVAEMRHCGLHRPLKAFVYRDWWSVRRRYEYDLDQLRRGILGGRVPPPPEEPFPAD